MLRTIIRNPQSMQVLSLYLILLAIFVMLYSISSKEPGRMRTVTGSLTAAFRSAGVPTREAEVLVSLDGTVVARSEAQKKFGTLIETAIPVARVVMVRPGAIMHSRLPVAELFEANSIALRPDRRELLEEIAELLHQVPEGLRFDLETVLGGAAAETAAQPSREVPLNLARAAALARGLADAGAPLGSVGAAVERGDDGWVRLIFRIDGAGAARGAAPPVESEK